VPIASSCILRRINTLFALLVLVSSCGLPISFDSDDSLDGDNSSWQPVFVDIDDQKHKPFEDDSCRALVMIFVMHDCPISNSYIPQLNRWHEWLDSHNIPLFLVHADPNIKLEQAREHASEYKITWPVVLDPNQSWVQRAGATRVPEAVVFSPQAEILYRGRIDNQYAGLGKRRAVTTSHELREALEAIIAGRPVEESRTEAVGCFIPTKEPKTKDSAGAEEHAKP